MATTPNGTIGTCICTYFEAKGWLSTFEHPTGPGTVGFDIKVNTKIYHKLLVLCHKGTAATYARFLLDRYEGFSKLRQLSLRQLIENNPDKPPTDENKIDWFLESVTEKTYDSVHATCTDKLLDGDLTFAKVIKLYTHRCFQRYPNFQLDDPEHGTTKTVSNNSTIYTDGKRDNGKGKGSGRGRFSQPNFGGRGRIRIPSSPSRSRTLFQRYR
jgi:hypothetical protein